MDFKNKVILITGAGSGIGAATAIRFSKLSASLALVDKNESTLRETILACGDKHLAVIADLTKQEDLLTIVPRVIERYGKLDVLVNVAGIMTLESILDDDVIEKYELLTSINVKAPIVLMNKAAPYLVLSKGNIVNISSVRSSRPRGDAALYCLSKSGLEMFTKCVALDLAGKGVRVNTVHPGIVRTNLQHSFDPSIDLEQHYSKFNKMPFGVIEPEEVAKVITFLASEDAKSVTGSSYYIDGGFNIMK